MKAVYEKPVLKVEGSVEALTSAARLYHGVTDATYPMGTPDSQVFYS